MICHVVFVGGEFRRDDTSRFPSFFELYFWMSSSPIRFRMCICLGIVKWMSISCMCNANILPGDIWFNLTTQECYVSQIRLWLFWLLNHCNHITHHVSTVIYVLSSCVESRQDSYPILRDITGQKLSTFTTVHGTATSYRLPVQVRQQGTRCHILACDMSIIWGTGL